MACKNYPKWKAYNSVKHIKLMNQLFCLRIVYRLAQRQCFLIFIVFSAKLLAVSMKYTIQLLGYFHLRTPELYLGNLYIIVHKPGMFGYIWIIPLA